MFVQNRYYFCFIIITNSNNNFYNYLYLDSTCVITISLLTNNIITVTNSTKDTIRYYTYNSSYMYNYIHIFINFI